MRRLSGVEMREALQQAESYVKPAVQETEEKQPSPAELHADRMLVDAFGVEQTADPPPWMQRLRSEFTRGHEQGQRLQRPLDRVENTRGLSKSYNKFELVRDWEPKPKL